LAWIKISPIYLFEFISNDVVVLPVEFSSLYSLRSTRRASCDLHRELRNGCSLPNVVAGAEYLQNTPHDVPRNYKKPPSLDRAPN
jgi:hypothetical protein